MSEWARFSIGKQKGERAEAAEMEEEEEGSKGLGGGRIRSPPEEARLSKLQRTRARRGPAPAAPPESCQAAGRGPQRRPRSGAGSPGLRRRRERRRLRGRCGWAARELDGARRGTGAGGRRPCDNRGHAVAQSESCRLRVAQGAANSDTQGGLRKR